MLVRDFTLLALIGSFAAAALGASGCGSDDATLDHAGGTTASATATATATGTATGTGTTGSTSTGTGVGGAGAGGAGGGGAGTGGGPMVDLDLDGLDDAFEAEVAQSYLPFLSLDPADGCALGGILYRVSPHPGDATKLLVYYDHLFETDCGLGGHVGDNEVFTITADPATPPPAGILAMKAISHQGTACQHISECGGCGLDACTMAPVGGVDTPVVFSSKDKHGTYVGSACTVVTCFDTCTLAPATTVVPMVNAGEPGAHLTEDLTANGFITAANGWSEPELMSYDPWGGLEFGSAGIVADDLVDPAFVTVVCP